MFTTIAALLLTFTGANAQFTVTRDSSYTDVLVTNFPNGYTLGAWLCQPAAGFADYSGVEITIMPAKAGFPVYDYSKLSNFHVEVMWFVTGGGMTVGDFPASLVPGIGATKQVVLTFPYSITPPDGWMYMRLSAQFEDGVDTTLNTVMCSARVMGHAGSSSGVYTSASVSSFTTYAEQVLTFKVVPVSDRIVTNLPVFSGVVGTFEMTAHEALSVNQFNLQTSGQFNGYIPEFLNPRIVDSFGNNLTPPSTGSGSSIGVGGMPVHFAKGERRRFYVLSDIVSGTPGDFIRMQMTGACGTVDPFQTIVNNSFFCDDHGSQLAEKTTYQPVTAVNEVIAGKDVVVYPNPAVDQFTIQYPGEWTASLTDMSGRQLQIFSGFDSKEIVRSNLPSGVYLLSIQTAGQQVVKKKIVLQ